MSQWFHLLQTQQHTTQEEAAVLPVKLLRLQASEIQNLMTIQNGTASVLYTESHLHHNHIGISASCLWILRLSVGSDDFNIRMSVQEGYAAEKSFCSKLKGKKYLPDLRDFCISELWKVIMDGNRHFIDEGTWDPERCNESPTCASLEVWHLGFETEWNTHTPREWGPEEREVWALLMLVVVEPDTFTQFIRGSGHLNDTQALPHFWRFLNVKCWRNVRLDYEVIHMNTPIHIEWSSFVDNI